MTTLLHNTCKKMPSKGDFTVSVVVIGNFSNRHTHELKGRMYFKIESSSNVRIKQCPFCGQTAGEIIKYY
jgi:hypothetical protein